MIDTVNLKAELVAYLHNLRSLGDYDVVVDRLTNITKIRSLVNYYLNAVEVYNDDDKVIIELIINILQEIYNNGTIDSPVPDEEYDMIYELNRLINDNEIVGASIGVKNKPTGFHRYPDLRGSLDKLHFVFDTDKPKGKKEIRRSIEEWIRSCENRMGRKFKEHELDITIFPKWDGISIIFETDLSRDVIKALSRGDTDINEAIDYTRMFKDSTNFDFIDEFKYHEVGIKTETVMNQKNYKKLCEEYGDFKSTRSAVSSIFNSNELDKSFLKYLTVIPLQVQNFDTKEIEIPSSTYEDYPYVLTSLDDLHDVKLQIEMLRKEVNDKLGIDIDGVVIRLNTPSVKDALGREGRINKYEAAFKFPPEQKKTILKDIEFSVGVFGTVTPVAIVEPVKLNGNTINSPSLGSIDIFESHSFNEGDEVIIKYNIIPYLEVDETCKKGTGKKFVTPTNCTYCGHLLVKDPVLRCVNLDCDCRVIGKIANYVEKMKVPEISIGTITTLHKYGFLKSIEDLYKLDGHEYAISQLPGLGTKSIQKIIKGINSRKKVYDYELLGSIGIPSIGRRIFKKILNIYYLTELLELSSKNQSEKLIKLGGIQQKTANKIINGINLNADLIEFLRSKHQLMREEVKEYKAKVYFTKVRDIEFENFLESQGIQSADSYSKDVDYLIVSSMGVTSSKTEKAKEQGRPIMTIEEAYNFFGYNK
jgi:DNA ligase (NAD+)